MEQGQSLHILLIDDEEIVHQTLAPYLRDLGHNVENAYDGAGALKMVERREYDIAFVDVQMPGIDGLSLLSRFIRIRPGLSCVIITGHGNMEMVIQVLRLGAADFLTKPIKLLELEAVIEKTLRIRSLQYSQRLLKDSIIGIQASNDYQLRNRSLIGKSRPTYEIRKQIQMAIEAQCDTILITGETGTGKEVVAREIHFMGMGDERPFIAVSCPALPDTLIESELFGHVKGSFTGATIDKPGYFEMANHGTLFLDEVADLSPSAQAKLLRILETRKVRRIGGAEEKNLDITIIAATNESLEGLVGSKKFRQDLYYRLNVFTINLLPLRERRADILPLADYFLSMFIKGRRLHVKGISSGAQELLINYDYPGNARELRNIIERAAILASSGYILPQQLNLPDLRPHISRQKNITDEDRERATFIKALEEVKWNRYKAAKKLGIPYSTLRYKINKLGIS